MLGQIDEMSERQSIPRESRLAVLTEAGYRCASPNCPNELTVEVHHIVEVKKDGGHELDNLLPLCPYCHDKYHRSLIDARSIRDWKKRVQQIYRSATERPDRPSDVAPSHGYAPAFASFTDRTYPVWYFYEYGGRLKFYPAGYATYIDRNCLVTSRAVLYRLDQIRQRIPDGTPKLVLGFATLDFTVEEIYKWGGVVVLKSSPVDERQVWCSETKTSTDADRVLPDESPFPKIAKVPFVG